MEGTTIVIIGSDEYRVTARYTREATYKAARLFKSKYHLSNPPSEIVVFAQPARLPDPECTTERVLVMLEKMAETPA